MDDGEFSTGLPEYYRGVKDLSLYQKEAVKVLPAGRTGYKFKYIMVRNLFFRTINTFRCLIRERAIEPYNILRIAGMFTGKVFTGPLKVSIDITDKCDMKCRMCWYHSPLFGHKNGDEFFHMPLVRFKELIRELVSLRTKIVMLTGEGEPLLHPDIVEMVRIIRRNKMDVEVMTNAYYLDRGKVDAFVNAGVKKIIVSLHAADAETFIKIRPESGKEGVDRIIANLRYFASLAVPKPALFITNVISALNWQSVDKMTVLAEELKADKILFKPLTLPRDCFPLLRLSPFMIYRLNSELRELLSKSRIANNINSYCLYINKRRSRQAERSARINKRLFTRRTSHKRNFCYIPWTQSVIGLDGSVSGCVYAGSANVGNIYKQSFRKIWIGDEYVSFRLKRACSYSCGAKAVYPLLRK